MTDQSAPRSEAGGLSADGLRHFFWPDDGSDPVARLLIIAIAVVLAATLAMLGYVVYAASNASKAPSNRVDRQLLILDAVTKTEPSNTQAWADYTALLTGTGQYSLAQEVIDRGIEATKGHPSLLTERARLSSARGRQAEALSQLDVASKAARAFEDRQKKELADKGVVTPEQPNEYLIAAEVLRAEIYEGMMRWKDAESAYTTAIKERSDMSDILTARGDVRLKLKATEKARQDYETALKMIPDYAPALKGLETIKKETGK